MENNSSLPPILSKPKLTKKYEPSPCDYQILALIEREQLTVMDVLDAMLPNPTSYLYLRVDLLDKAGLLTRYRAHSNAERVWKKPGEILGTAAREEPGMLRTLSCCSVPPPPLFGRLVPDAQGFFCKRADGHLIVTVANQGSTGAGPSATRVDFGAYGAIDLPTPALAAGASVDLKFPIPPGCFDPDCEFRIVVDVNNVVVESDEGNNFASGVCLG